MRIGVWALGLSAVICVGACANVIGIGGFSADRDPSVDGGGGDGGGGPPDTGGTEGSPNGTCASTCGTPGCGTCPTTPRVPITSGASPYSIDAHEVSLADYAAWLATKPQTGVPTSTCSWNDSFEPGVVSPKANAILGPQGIPVDSACTGWAAQHLASGNGHLPIVCVDYCDAVAYCIWAKGHLCGAIGGGALSYNSNHNPERGEWWNACSAAGTRVYPYGNTYQPDVCNTQGHGLVDVGSKQGCEGSVSGLFDMSGNAIEWEDSCSSFDNPPEGQTCLLRGGTEDQTDPARLTCSAFRENPRGFQDSVTGFRCCGT